jgi:hypothetical protein
VKQALETPVILVTNFNNNMLNFPQNLEQSTNKIAIAKPQRN